MIPNGCAIYKRAITIKYTTCRLIKFTLEKEEDIQITIYNYLAL